MAIDENTYGFEKQDAQALLRHVGGGDEEYSEGRVRGGGSVGGLRARVYRTPSGGIAARSGSTLGSATCTRITVTSGTRTVTADTETVYNNFLSTVKASVDVIAVIIDGVWVVQAEDCS